MKPNLFHAALCATLAGAGLPASAHVTLEYQVAPAESSYKATFKISHGCEQSPTRQVAVTMPAGVLGARPMPKPGWSLEVQRGKLAQPVTYQGRTTTEDVVRVTWTARTPADMLAPDHYDEFAVVARMPSTAGTIYWPVNQVCENGRIDWVEVPREGRKLSDLKSPAAALEILPAAASGGHRH
jgi:uncharacterized protein YcnI